MSDDSVAKAHELSKIGYGVGPKMRELLGALVQRCKDLEAERDDQLKRSQAAFKVMRQAPIYPPRLRGVHSLEMVAFAQGWRAAADVVHKALESGKIDDKWDTLEVQTFRQLHTTIAEQAAVIEAVRALHSPDLRGWCHECDMSRCPTIAALAQTDERKAETE